MLFQKLDTAVVEIEWVVQGAPPDGLPLDPKIYALLDPNDYITESHDETTNRSNNKGYALLYAPGDPASPVDPESGGRPDRAGRTNRLDVVDSSEEGFHGAKFELRRGPGSLESLSRNAAFGEEAFGH